MHPIIQKTFGGLSPAYYFRQFVFGSVMAAVFIYGLAHTGKPMPIGTLFLLLVSTLLYPYSRFVYERVVAFIMGDNVFFVNVVLMLFVKIVSMLSCWMFAIFVAPAGLAYLYVHHSRAGHDPRAQH